MRTTIRYFISYAHADEPLAGEFVARIDRQLKPARAYDHRLWRDTAILVGEAWKAEIDDALAQCHLGLLLISPSFLASPWVRDEVRRLLERSKGVIPVMLRPVDLQRHDLQGLSELQIFRLDGKRAYDQCRDDRTRSAFAEQLFLQIEQRLDRMLGSTDR